MKIEVEASEKQIELLSTLKKILEVRANQFKKAESDYKLVRSTIAFGAKLPEGVTIDSILGTTITFDVPDEVETK